MIWSSWRTDSRSLVCEGDDDEEDAPAAAVQVSEQSEAAADGDTKPSTTTAGNPTEALFPPQWDVNVHLCAEQHVVLPLSFTQRDTSPSR